MQSVTLLVIEDCISSMPIHKNKICRSLVYGCALGLLATPAIAASTTIQGFFDTNTASEKFFKVGRQRMEQEIKRLNRQQPQAKDTILQIDEQTKLNEQELEDWDRLLPQLHQQEIN